MNCGAKSSNPWAVPPSPARNTRGRPRPPQSTTSSAAPGAMRTIWATGADGGRPTDASGPLAQAHATQAGRSRTARFMSLAISFGSRMTISDKLTPAADHVDSIAAPADVAAVQRRTLRLLFTTQVISGVGVTVGSSVGALLAADIAGTRASGLAQSS